MFRNVENRGVWTQGSDYTFEVGALWEYTVSQCGRHNYFFAVNNGFLSNRQWRFHSRRDYADSISEGCLFTEEKFNELFPNNFELELNKIGNDYYWMFEDQANTDALITDITALTPYNVYDPYAGRETPWSQEYLFGVWLRITINIPADFPSGIYYLVSISFGSRWTLFDVTPYFWNVHAVARRIYIGEVEEEGGHNDYVDDVVPYVINYNHWNIENYQVAAIPAEPEGFDHNRTYTWRGSDGQEHKYLIVSGVNKMATKRITGYASGNTIYDLFRDENGQVLNPTTMALETWGYGSHTRIDYAFDLTDQSGDFYTGDYGSSFPIGAELYRCTYLQAGANPADGDSLIEDRPERIKWTGESVIVEGDELTVTNLCNKAILMCGGAWDQKKLSSYFETSATAELCQMKYPEVRKEVLIRGAKAGVNWNESTKFADLGDELSGDNIPDMAEWKYAFTLPSDCLRVIAQVSESDHKKEYEHAIMNGMLLTNDYSNDDKDSAYIKYVFDQTDITKFTPLLYQAIATKLAAELSPVLGDSKRRRDLLDEYEGLVLSLAGGKNQAESYYKNDGARKDIADARHRAYGKDA